MYLRGQTALLAEAQSEMLVRQVLREGPLHVLKYTELFAQKDLVRSQCLVAFFAATYDKPIEGNAVTSFRAPDYSDHGALSTLIPIWRNIMEATPKDMGPEQLTAMKAILANHPMPADVQKLCDLVYPVTPSFTPITTPSTEIHEAHEETILE